MDEPASKKARTDAENDGKAGIDYSHVTGVDEVERKAVEHMESLQSSIDKINEEASEEILKVEQKYNQKRKPLFDQRNDVIAGIPHFWVATFVNHPQLSSILDEEEEQCLNSLSKLEVEEFDDIKSGFRIRFTFDANEYFENDVIEKTYHLASADQTSESTPIKWKEGKNLAERVRFSFLSTEVVQSKNIRREGVVFSRSFFEWLNESVDPAQDEISEVIKDDIWPNPLQYFLVANGEDNDNDESDVSGEDEEEEMEGEEVDQDGEDEGDLVDEEGASDAENDENAKH